MKKLHPVLVEWEDSQTRGRWDGRDQYEIEQPAQIRTCGFLVARDKTRVVLVQSECADGQVADSMTIPAGCVKRIRRLHA